MSKGGVCSFWVLSSVILTQLMHSAVTYAVVAMRVCVLLYKHCSLQQSSVIILPACSLDLCKCCAAALHCILELQLTCELLVVCLEAAGK